MNYSVGSLADLISGSNTPNKPKVVQKEFIRKPNKTDKNIERHENEKNKLRTSTDFKQKHKNRNKVNSEQFELKQPVKKAKKRKISKTGDVDINFENANSDESPSKKSKKEHKKSKTSFSENESDKNDNESTENENNALSVLKQNPKDDEQNQLENRKVSKTKEEILAITEEHNKRTVFVGNLPINVNKKMLKKKFEKIGKVECIRLRSAPIADERIPKKVAIIRKQFHKDRKSINGYVRFIERKDAIEATKLNGTEYKDHHIRVKLCDDTEKRDQNRAIFLGNVSFEIIINSLKLLDRLNRFIERKDAIEATKLNGTEYKDHHIRVKLCDDTEKRDQNRAIFLGNVSFDAEEEELWKLFEQCGPIESVRLVRDRKTNVGKGFGYINFASADSVELALQMENVKLRDRELRISACENKKNKKKIKEHVKQDGEEKTGFENKRGKPVKKDFQGKKISDKKKKKKFDRGSLQKKKLVKKIAPKSIS